MLRAKATRSLSSSYLSEGPSRHVIGNEQKLKAPVEVDGKKVKLQFDITLSQAIQSVSENFGDFLKEFNHHEGESDEAVAVRGSKYFGRICKLSTWRSRQAKTPVYAASRWCCLQTSGGSRKCSNAPPPSC